MASIHFSSIDCFISNVRYKLDHDAQGRRSRGAPRRAGRGGLAAGLARGAGGRDRAARAEEAGWSTGAVVHYFSDKEELLLFAFRTVADRVGAGSPRPSGRTSRSSWRAAGSSRAAARPRPPGRGARLVRVPRPGADAPGPGPRSARGLPGLARPVADPARGAGARAIRATVDCARRPPPWWRSSTGSPSRPPSSRARSPRAGDRARGRHTRRPARCSFAP